jgi:hypothetical protein
MSDAWEIDDAEDDHDLENHLYLKYMFDGIGSLTDLSVSLRALADEFDERARTGWRLAQPVDSGWAHLVPPG